MPLSFNKGLLQKNAPAVGTRLRRVLLLLSKLGRRAWCAINWALAPLTAGLAVRCRAWRAINWTLAPLTAGFAPFSPFRPFVYFVYFVVCLPLLVSPALATGKVHQHALDLYSRLRTANTNVLVSPATRSVGLHQPSPVTPQATSISLDQPAWVTVETRCPGLSMVLSEHRRCTNVTVFAISGPVHESLPDASPSCRIVTLALADEPHFSAPLTCLCMKDPVPYSIKVATVDLDVSVPAVSNISLSRIVALYVPGSSNAVAPMLAIDCRVSDIRTPETPSIATSTLSHRLPDMPVPTIVTGDLHDRFFTQQQELALTPIPPHLPGVSSIIPRLHCTIDPVHTNIVLLALSDVIEAGGGATKSPVSLVAGFLPADTHVTSATPCSSLALQYADPIITPYPCVTLAFSAPGQSGTSDLISRSFKLAAHLPEHASIPREFRVVRSIPVSAPLTPPFDLHSLSMAPCELPEQTLVFNNKISRLLQQLASRAVAFNAFANTYTECPVLAWKEPPEISLPDSVSMQQLSPPAPLDAAPVFVSCSGRRAINVTLCSITLSSSSVARIDHSSLDLAIRKDALVKRFADLSSLPALEHHRSVRSIDVSAFSVENPGTRPTTRAALAPLALGEHVHVLPELTRLNIIAHEPAQTCVAMIDRVLIDQILDAAQQGTINPRNPKNREDVVWFLASHSFTPDAYKVFRFMLQSCAGNTDRKKTDSMRSWAEKYRAGEYACIVSYYAAYHLYDSSDFIGAGRIIADYLEKHQEHRDRILVLDALCAAQRGENRNALSSLQEVCSGRHGSAMIPKATFLIAWVHFQESNINDARTVLEDLVREYPESESAGKAKQILASLTNRE